MKTKEFVLKIADLFLMADEGTSDWVDIPNLRRTWYVFFIIFLLYIFVFFIGLSLPIENSSIAVFAYRCIKLSFLAVLSTSLLFMVFQYFRHVVKKNYPVHLGTVVWFYFLHIFLWCLMYRNIYLIFPDAFIYENPPTENLETLIKGFPSIILTIHFLLYSSFQSLNASFYRLTCNSLLPSILSWVQTLFTLSLVTLIIASYINQKAHPRQKENHGNEDRRTNG